MKFIKTVKNQVGQNIRIFESSVNSMIIAQIGKRFIPTGSHDETDFFEGSELNPVLFKTLLGQNVKKFCELSETELKFISL